MISHSWTQHETTGTEVQMLTVQIILIATKKLSAHRRHRWTEFKRKTVTT